MLIELDAAEARVLGSLVEKSLTTREQYPLTFNSLLNACNQKSSREPVMNLDTETMGRAVQKLVEKGLVERLQAPGERVPKFSHDIGKLLGSDEPRLIGIFTVLLLRGPQTPGEIKGRTERLCQFASTAEVEGLMQELCAKPEPMAARLPRGAGQKEARYAHLFSGPPAAQPEAAPAAVHAAAAQPGDDRLAQLEKRLAELEAAVKAIKDELDGPAAPV